MISCRFGLISRRRVLYYRFMPFPSRMMPRCLSPRASARQKRRTLRLFTAYNFYHFSSCQPNFHATSRLPLMPRQPTLYQNRQAPRMPMPMPAAHITIILLMAALRYRRLPYFQILRGLASADGISHTPPPVSISRHPHFYRSATP